MQSFNEISSHILHNIVSHLFIPTQIINLKRVKMCFVLFYFIPVTPRDFIVASGGVGRLPVGPNRQFMAEHWSVFCGLATSEASTDVHGWMSGSQCHRRLVVQHHGHVLRRFIDNGRLSGNHVRSRGRLHDFGTNSTYASSCQPYTRKLSFGNCFFMCMSRRNKSFENF